LSPERKIELIVKGRKGDYWVKTLLMWLEEIRDILEQEYNIKLFLKFEEDPSLEMPIIISPSGEIIFNEILEEPGYIVEYLKKYLDKVVKYGD